MTVLSARKSFAAISEFERPRTTIPRICFSRVDSLGWATMSRAQRGKDNWPAQTPRTAAGRQASSSSSRTKPSTPAPSASRMAGRSDAAEITTTGAPHACSTIRRKSPALASAPCRSTTSASRAPAIGFFLEGSRGLPADRQRRSRHQPSTETIRSLRLPEALKMCTQGVKTARSRPAWRRVAIMTSYWKDTPTAAAATGTHERARVHQARPNVASGSIRPPSGPKRTSETYLAVGSSPSSNGRPSTSTHA